MTIIPAALLTQDDLRLLGNNLTVSEPVVEHLDDDPIAAAERSLAALGEPVEWFTRAPTQYPKPDHELDDPEDPIHLALAS